MYITQALRELSSQLAAVSETPSLDAQTLLAHVLGSSRAWVLAHPEAGLNPGQEEALRAAGARLAGGEPLPYILGHWEFYGLDFILTPDVLIPRPETELLVARALEWLRAHPNRRSAADIGTGSGCIAISLAVNLPDLHVLATDVSAAALEVAKANAEMHNVTKCIQFLPAELTTLQPIDLIVANLPYIPTPRLESLAVARREPRLALDGGPDGLDAIRGLMPTAGQWLAPGGCCLLEIDASQGEAAWKLAQSFFPGAKISIIPDLAGLDRLMVVQR